MAYARPEIFVCLCDAYAGCGSQKLACARCGVSKPTLHRWLSESLAGKPDYEMEYLDEKMKFHEAFGRAYHLAIREVSDALISRSMLGHEEVVRYKGEIIYKRRLDIPPADAADPDLCEMLYGQRDNYLRTERGELIADTMHHEPPVAAQLAVLAAHDPTMWGSQQNISVTNTTNGVIRIKNDRPEPTPVPVPVAPLAIEHQPAEIVPEPEHVQEPEMAAAEPMADASQAAPVSVDDDGNATYAEPAPEAAMVTHIDLSKLTPAQLAAREHFLKLAAKPPAHPRPTAAVQVFKPSDEPSEAPAPVVRPPPPPAGGAYQSDDARREGLGSGVVAPGGMKVR